MKKITVTLTIFNEDENRAHVKIDISTNSEGGLTDFDGTPAAGVLVEILELLKGELYENN